jgi:hypothetical protein
MIAFTRDFTRRDSSSLKKWMSLNELERHCGLGGETSTKSEEKRCLKRKKEDFGEAMRLFRKEQKS